jgi:hypothetical protein
VVDTDNVEFLDRTIRLGAIAVRLRLDVSS